MINYSDVIIIGGGAAGFFGAINTAQHNRNLKITILEATAKVLGKVKISGGGRCNVTHHCFNPSDLIQNYPRGAKELRGAFSRFQPQDTINWFESRGVKLKIEDDGRIFPVTDDSQTIIDCLVKNTQQLGIKILTKTPVKDVEKSELGFNVILKSGEILTTKNLLIATGSNPLGYEWAKKLGHSIQPPVPSLFTFKINDIRIKDLAGISVQNVHLQLDIKQKKKLEQSGALLITHWGISAPSVLKLSAWGARILHDSQYNLPLIINWLPAYNLDSIREELLQIKTTLAKQKVINYNQFNLPKRLWQSLVNYTLTNSDKIWANINKQEIKKLSIELTKGNYLIQGKGIFKDEFVTCGGVTLKEVDFKTMMSKICPNLYFAGEVLDIDGITGGFNFQNAWTTGYIAGEAIN